MKRNANEILANVNACIKELEELKEENKFIWDYDSRVVTQGWNKRTYKLKMKKVYKELSIFDWWVDYLSLTQLNQMKKFLETAIELGFTGYVCFKVGVKGCSHGMWAYKAESEDGYSPDGDCLFHSFRSGDNYYDLNANGHWMSDNWDGRFEFSLTEVKKALEV